VVDLGYLAALLGGVLTLLSPCGALLLPSFFAYAFERPAVLVQRTVVFTAGVLATLVPLGISATFASRLLLDHRGTVVLVAGSLLIGLGGVHALGGVQSFGASRSTRPLAGVQARVAGRTSSAAVFGLGAVYGLASTCAGPILGAMLTIAATDPRPARGAALLAVYGLGMTLPLFGLALVWRRYDLAQRGWLRGRPVRLGNLQCHSTNLVAGALFVGLGVLLLLTDGFAVGLPGLPDSTAFVSRVQAAVLHLDGRASSAALLLVAGTAASTVLVGRLRARRRDGSVRRGR
jgi:cytochrome c biogenesis protein CcdA